MEDELIASEKLFSYGTLRYEKVQLATFGRKLIGHPDTLAGYKLSPLQISDPYVIATSGEAIHEIMIVTDNQNDKVKGIVFNLTFKELELADQYEVSDYKRIKVKLASGVSAWTYVDKLCKII